MRQDIELCSRRRRADRDSTCAGIRSRDFVHTTTHNRFCWAVLVEKFDSGSALTPEIESPMCELFSANDEPPASDADIVVAEKPG